MGHAPIPTPLDTGLRRYDGGLVKATGEIKAAAAFLDKVEGGFETRPYGTTQRVAVTVGRLSPSPQSSPVKGEEGADQRDTPRSPRLWIPAFAGMTVAL